MIRETSEGLTYYERSIISMRGDNAAKSDEVMLTECALGLAEEVSEVLCEVDGRSNGSAISELGDVSWYGTTAAHRLGMTLNEIRSHETETGLSEYDPNADYVRNMARSAGAFAGLVKKWLHCKTPLNRDLAARYLAEIFESAKRVARQLDCTMDDAFAANIAKLRKRFPSGGFTAAEANARADEER